MTDAEEGRLLEQFSTNTKTNVNNGDFAILYR
jgi:hypothetical protein